ncbi:activating transcription factor 7-interacting protein 1-like [Diretmus argenteus]
MESFWSEEWGLSFFNTTMHRNRYREIMRYLRFDKKESRHIRLSSEKFALISEVWERFVNNSIACYKPGANITVDKQVLPTKARCHFTQYMANEPDKFGIKFWLAADVDSKYVVNGFPYLSKDENRPAHQHLGEGERGDEADGAILPPAQPTPAPTSTAMVTQSSILQLITSSSKAVTTLATGITTQTPTGTLLLKTAAGSNMMGPGQPLLIQLPLSMTNGQTGTLVNFPVSSLSAANSLNKGKTSTTTTTYILKPAPIITVATSSSVAGTVSALQASTGQMSPGQISLARVVYSGGTGGINTPKAGVSVTAARTPAQLVSVAGAMSSASSPATSGPAATGSTAPGPPQGTSMTSKTDNQATGSSPAKPAVSGVHPKGSVIDLTEDDDEVQGVKNATAAPPSTTQRPPQVISIPNIAGARSSPQSNLPTSSNPQLTVHHRPPLDSPIKSRAVSSTTPTRASTMSLPPLPSAPAPPGRLPPEAAQTSPPQQPQLKLVPRQTGIVLSWCVSETDRSCATVESYHLYAFHQDNSSSNNAAQQHWKKFGEVEALPLPMACALTQFQSGSTYHFAVRAKDIYGRYGSFCEPQCTNGINSSSS